MADYLYLDIETIGTTSPAHIDRIAADIKPPATMKKPETIKAWEENDKADAIKEAVSKTSFDGGYGHVCCIGWAWNDEEVNTTSFTPEGLNEYAALSNFVRVSTQQRPAGYGQVTLVGHYVADFDIRFLWQRAFVMGVKMPVWFPRDPKPWSKEVNDSMQMWAGSKGTVSLDRLCFYLGIEGKTGVDGSMVAGMFERGEHKAIAEYCRQDVERVRKVHKRMLVAYGEQE